jgi:hypothetical protein
LEDLQVRSDICAKSSLKQAPLLCQMPYALEQEKDRPLRQIP